MNNYFLLFITPLLVSLTITPILVNLAMRNEVVDVPGERKIHKSIKPLMGGFSVYIAIFVSVVAFYSFSLQLTALLMATTIIVGIGMFDDFHNMRPLIKLFGQISAAVILVLLCSESIEPALNFLDNLMGFRFLSYTVIVFWIVAVTNAFNFIDGLDGLCTGSAIVTGIFLAALAYISGSSFVLGISLIVVAACLGFYPYNFQPAKIFLGDTGSMLVGFTLSSIMLFLFQDNTSYSLVIGGLLFFAYPAVDITYAIIRRLKNRMPIFTADREHIHHQLLDAGFSVRQTDYIIYAGSFILGLSGLTLILYPTWQAYLAIAAIAVFITAALIINRRRNLPRSIPTQHPTSTTQNHT